jgi:hypothetical protein
MPNKYPKKKGWKLSKQKYKSTNWSDYNTALGMAQKPPVLVNIMRSEFCPNVSPLRHEYYGLTNL